MPKRYLIANWKMNLPGEGVESFCRAVRGWTMGADVETVIAPPFPFLMDLAGFETPESREFTVAAQNCSSEPKGAFTGEVSVEMLLQVGARDVIIGHSERRHIFHEDDALIGRKLAAVAEGGLTPILCIGEEESVRESGGTNDLLRRQLEAALGAVTDPPDDLIVAYEPVWAIGTGKHATAEIVAETHGEIGRILEALAGRTFPILYGGSVSPENASDLAAVQGVDGFLVGGASLVSARFEVIGHALEQES